MKGGVGGCRRFTNTLAIMVWLSVAWIAYEMYYKVRAVHVKHQGDLAKPQSLRWRKLLTPEDATSPFVGQSSSPSAYSR